MAHSAYVHIPFCAHKCDFCDFTAFAGLNHLMEPYCQVVCREIADRLRLQPNEGPLTSVFYGGGTPGLIEARQLQLIHQTLAECAGIADEAEVTLETTPKSITLSKARDWLSMGVNRISIGIESLQEAELAAMGRGENSQEALQGIENALQAGFTNINCDLMYGLPKQTLASWGDTLERVFSFRLPHLSAYGLTIANASPLLSRYPLQSEAYPCEDSFADMYQLLVEMTSQSGLKQYEISNFCRPGFESMHNLSYWRNDEYLAFGVGAYRYVGGVREHNWRAMKRYMESPLQAENSELIDEDTRKREAIFLALRTRAGIDPVQFQLRYKINFVADYGKSIEKLMEGGFMEEDDKRLRLTQKGILVSNLVMAEFM